jgi:syndecan 1
MAAPGASIAGTAIPGASIAGAAIPGASIAGASMPAPIAAGAAIPGICGTRRSPVLVPASVSEFLVAVTSHPPAS